MNLDWSSRFVMLLNSKANLSIQCFSHHLWKTLEGRHPTKFSQETPRSLTFETFLWNNGDYWSWNNLALTWRSSTSETIPDGFLRLLIPSKQWSNLPNQGCYPKMGRISNITNTSRILVESLSVCFQALSWLKLLDHCTSKILVWSWTYHWHVWIDCNVISELSGR